MDDKERINEAMVKYEDTENAWPARYAAAAYAERRERIATAAMVGILAADVDSLDAIDAAARYAVKYADALLAQLSKPKEPS